MRGCEADRLGESTNAPERRTADGTQSGVAGDGRPSAICRWALDPCDQEPDVRCAGTSVPVPDHAEGERGRGERDLLGDPGGERQRLGGVERQSACGEHVGQPHYPKVDRRAVVTAPQVPAGTILGFCASLRLGRGSYWVILLFMKTAISIPDDTFRRAEERAASLGISRSEFFAQAARQYLDQLDAESLVGRIDAAVELAGADESNVFAVGAGHRRLIAGEDDW